MRYERKSNKGILFGLSVVLLLSSNAWGEIDPERFGTYKEDGQIFDSLGDYNQYRSEKIRQKEIIDILKKIEKRIEKLEKGAYVFVYSSPSTNTAIYEPANLSFSIPINKERP